MSGALTFVCNFLYSRVLPTLLFSKLNSILIDSQEKCVIVLVFCYFMPNLCYNCLQTTNLVVNDLLQQVCF